ncbi:MAG: TorF family putative porin [Caulobacteraceae bacterium]|nr:TorF family putative porin [Caulobacteraceae bacterium]
MNTNSKQPRQNLRFLVLVAAAAGVTSAVPALADPVSGQIGIASQYLGKGLGKSDEDPALFGSVRWDSNGFYANGFASQAASSRGADAEVIVAAGYAREIGDWGFDGQVMYREMLNETNGVDSGFVEWQGDISRKLTDRLSARMRFNYASDTYGAGEEAWWTEAQATITLTSKDKLSVAYGMRRIDNGTDYDAWNIGVKHKISPAVSADLRWYDTDGHEFGSRYEGRLVASIAYSF